MGKKGLGAYLTHDQKREVIEAITRFARGHGYAPTVGDIADDLGMTKSAIHHRLRVLREEGKVTWENGQARTLRTTWH